MSPPGEQSLFVVVPLLLVSGLSEMIVDVVTYGQTMGQDIVKLGDEMA